MLRLILTTLLFLPSAFSAGPADLPINGYCSDLLATVNALVERMTESGWDRSVATRIAIEEPSLFSKISSLGDKPVNVYRAIQVDPEKYDPTFREFFRGSVKDQMYVTGDIDYAYAHSLRGGAVRGQQPRGMAIILEFQFPSAMAEANYITTIDITNLSSQAPFIKRVGVVPVRKLQQNPDLKIANEVKWYPFEKAFSHGKIRELNP